MQGYIKTISEVLKRYEWRQIGDTFYLDNANVVSAVIECSKIEIFNFLRFREEYQKKERRKVMDEQHRLGGIFTWANASDEIIYNEYLKQKQ